MVMALVVVALALPVFGANQTPRPIWAPADSTSWWQPISFAPDVWSPVGDATASCDAAFSRDTTTGRGALILVSSGTACADTRSLALTLQGDRATLFATISATEATSLSTNFDLALRYRLSDTLIFGVQEMQGTEANLLGSLVAVPTLAPAAAWVAGPVAWTVDAALTRFSLDYNSGPWFAHAAVVTSSLFTLQEIEIQTAIAPAWTANITIDRTVADFATVYATRLAVYGRAGDVSVGLNYVRTTTAIVLDSDDLLVPQTFTQSIDMPMFSVGVPKWGWQWTLSGTGGAIHNFTLTAQRSQPDIAVTISGDPFRVWLTYNSEF